jgi:hypothetical protein
MPRETHEAIRLEAQTTMGSEEKGLRLRSLHDARQRKKNARTRKWKSKWRTKRRRWERKAIMTEFIHQWQEQERERQNAEEEISKAKALLASVEESRAPVYVPEIPHKAKDTLEEAEENLLIKNYSGAVDLTSEIRERLEKTKDSIRMNMREKERGRYLYGVIPYDGEKSFGYMGLDTSEVYTIPFRDISSVVSPSPMKEYDLTEENAMKHQAVIRQVTGEHPVVPAEFGTVIKDETILKNLMTKSYRAIKECIKLIDGKVELGLKAVLKRDQNLTPIERNEITKAILDALKEKAEQLVKGNLFTNRLLLNVSFLVEKRRVDEFSLEVEGLEEKYADKLDLLYSGPWAPYNFVYIKIGAEGMSLKRK